MNVNCDEVRIDACNVNADYVVVQERGRMCIFDLGVNNICWSGVWTGSNCPQSVLYVSESHLQDIFYSVELICIA